MTDKIIDRSKVNSNYGGITEWRFTCWTQEDADAITALLRFKEAMTEKMWESLDYTLRTGIAGSRVKAALDTLRKALTTGGQ